MPRLVLTPSKPASVLVIDDDPQIRQLIARLLQPAGYRVEEAGSAREGMEKLRTSPPDLILLDMQLPDRSGHDLLTEIRSEPRTRLTPVVMITGAASMATSSRRSRPESRTFWPSPSLRKSSRLACGPWSS